MANGLLLRLRERELSASPAERNVIAYVSAHPHEVVGLSVRGLADATFSSPSSILRFCKRLGFAGYKEFQRELIAELALLGDRKDVALEDISVDDSVERIVGKVMKRTCARSRRRREHSITPFWNDVQPILSGRAWSICSVLVLLAWLHTIWHKSSCVSTRNAICTMTGTTNSCAPRTCTKAISALLLATRA